MWINTPEWDEAGPYWTAFWRGELLDRPPIMIYAPSGQDGPPAPEAPDLETQWTDPEYLLARNEAELPRRLYLGEALAASRTIMAAWCPVYGGRVRYLPDTIWIEPGVSDWDHAPDWGTAWDDAGWRLLTRVYAALCEGARGRYLVGLPPLLPPNDLLSMLRGPENFLVDLVAEPERVEDALGAMRQNFAHMWHRVNALRDPGQGYGNWWSVWCPDRLRILQSDVSCMISGAMFERFILPELHELSKDVVHASYHLDGPGAIRHLEMICSVPKIHTIQWVPGADQPGHGLHWMHLYKKVQSLGKAVWVSSSPQDMETFVRELDPRKLLLSTSVQTPAEAQQVKRDLVRWTATYWGGRR